MAYERMTSILNFRWDWAALFVAALLLAGLLILGRSKPLYVILRTAAFLILFWLALEPSFVSAPQRSQKPPLAILVDVSKSMSVLDPFERLAMVQDSLKKFRKDLERDFEVAYYEFSESLSKTDWEGVLRAKAKGSRTSIFGALKSLSEENSQIQTNVLLFSDGIDNFYKSPWTYDAPVFTVRSGLNESLKDISLKEVRGSDFAFKNRPVEFKVTIQNSGFKGVEAPLVLKEKKGTSWTESQIKQVRFPESDAAQEVQFRIVPPAPGVFEYHLEIPIQKGEITSSNNSQSFKLEVGREKIRILYLCGQPSTEYAFLRQLLKSDPSIELVSFVILRNPENVVPVAEDQLSLIPFPAQDIFVRTLGDFDLLIFENFSYSRFGISPAHLENIKRFVEEKGGGFIMIGGENSFSRGGYGGTAIDKILPVTLNPNQEEIVKKEVRLKVLEPQHPIFDSGESLEKIESVWKDMPALNGIHRLASLKKGASLLASGEGSPLIAAWQVKKGRVLALATLSTWQWALELSEQGFNQSPYTHFWRQTIRWLTTAQDSQPLRIVLTDSNFIVGRKISIKIMIQPEILKKDKAPDMELSIQSQGKTMQILPLTAAARSDYRAEWVPEKDGEYEIRAVLKQGTRRHETLRSLKVTNVDWEMKIPVSDPAVLKEIAEKSGGLFTELKSFTPEILKGKAKHFESAKLEKVKKALWLNPWVFALLLLILLSEWGIRRYRGEL